MKEFPLLCGDSFFTESVLEHRSAGCRAMLMMYAAYAEDVSHAAVWTHGKFVAVSLEDIVLNEKLSFSFNQ